MHVQAENLIVERTLDPKTPLSSQQLVFGKTFVSRLAIVISYRNTAFLLLRQIICSQ